MNLFIIYNFFIGLSIYWANGQPSRKQDEWYKEEWPTQPYAFGYEIRDYSGNEQYRKEMSDGEKVTGSYGYLGPDGLYRHVEYIADINGFRAKIRTSEPGTANDNPSNVQIEANPILVLPNPGPVGPGVTPGSPYGGVSTNPTPGNSFRRDGIRRPSENPQINPNPNRSTFANRPNAQPIPRIPDTSRGIPITDTPLDDRRPVTDGFNINRGPPPDVQPIQPIRPNFEEPPLRGSPVDSTRGAQNGQNGGSYGDIPDNVVPYRGANPQRPIVEDVPRDVPRFNDPRQNGGSAGDQGLKSGERRVRPPYAVRVPSQPYLPRPSQQPQPYDREFNRNDGRNEGPRIDDNRGRPLDRDYRPEPVGSPEDRRPITPRYEVTTKGGSNKIPPQDMGFIEATKGPITPYRPEGRFYDRPNAVFDDDNEYDDQFKRRQDDDNNVNVVNKPVFEDKVRDREGPRKIGGFVRSRYNTTRTDSRNRVKGQTPPTIRDSYNRTLNGSSFDANQGRRDSIDKRMRRPTKVFVTSGPISVTSGGIPDKRVPPIEGDNRSFGANDVQQRQQNDIEYDNRNFRDGQQIDSDGYKGHNDRDRPLPPIQREEIPQNIRPYYGARREYGRDSSVPKRPDHQNPAPRQPSPPYDSRDEQRHIQAPDEDIPHQRDYGDDQQPVGRPKGPQVFQPLMPNHRPDRQPIPRRPEPDRRDRPYRPRTQPQDRSYEEQQIEVQPYQTQNSASITSPVNTIPTAYKPVDSLDDERIPNETEKPFVKPSQNTPLSPSSYIVTPFPINETKIQIKPIIVSRPAVYTIGPEEYPQITQMEVPKFGTRLNTPEPPTQQLYGTIEETNDDHKEDQQKNFDYKSDANDQQFDQNYYQNDDTNDGQNLNPIDEVNPNLNPNPNSSPDNQQYDNVENDQYYYYEDEKEDVQSKDSFKDVIISENQKTDENFSMKSNNSSPKEITHKITNVMNWHKYDSGGQPLIQ